MKWKLSFVVLLSTQALAQSTSIKNYRQIVAALEAVTGIAVTDPEVQAVYQETVGRLPRIGAVEEVSPPALMAFASLSGMFCKKMISADVTLPAAQRRAHRDIDFADERQIFTRSQRMSVVREYADLFWQRIPTDGEVDALLLAMNPGTEQRYLTLDERLRVLLAACTSVSSSLASLTY